MKEGWQCLPRKRKKFAKKLLKKVINTTYDWDGKQNEQFDIEKQKLTK